VAEASSRAALIRRWVSGTFSGRALGIGAAVKLIAFGLRLAFGSATLVEAIDTIGDVALVVGAAILAYRLFVDAKRVVLWRVRRKLTLSYVFIGFVPALLIIAFFLIGGLLLFFNVSGYALRTGISSIVDQARFLAESASVELENAHTARDVEAVIERRYASASMHYPLVGYAVVPADRTCGSGSTTAGSTQLPPFTAGAWSHSPAPTTLPDWITCDGYAGLWTYSEGGHTRIAARAVTRPPALPRDAVVVDVPLDPALIAQLERQAGVQLDDVTLLGRDEAAATSTAGSKASRPIISLGTRSPQTSQGAGLPWVAFLEHTDWSSGEPGALLWAFRMSPLAVYERISVIPVRRFGSFNFGQVLLILLAVIASLFLLIQIAAFLMGVSLARSITGSVHELFAGTERVRRGDFTHKIAIRSRDQLGELAASFNSMTGSIEDLLQQKAEKERLEQELLIARNIQMSLLPQAAMTMPGVSLTAHCEPAREVGGDYYDFLPIDDSRFAVLIADVAGKGTSAALYMAELKGIILSLSQRYRSPRALLMDANRILARHLDTRTFITITYAVIDVDAGTLTYARAGHCPLIYLPGPQAADRRAQVLLPDGMVLGLNLDAGELFDGQLEESTLRLNPGDLFLLYTDGITEAMNADGDCFGDARLSALIETHADLPGDELRERIVREVISFAGTTVQQDDMTMLILKVEDVGRRTHMIDDESEMAWSRS
jgi:serine phosphatase RsbU (regulator of sigma subunit)